MAIKLLYLLHFSGFIMGFAASIANARMMGLMATADPAERPILARFMPRMAPIGQIGVVLLWISGLCLLHLKWGANAAGLSWIFHVKILAVVVLTGVVIRLHLLSKKAQGGDASAAAKIPGTGKIGAASAGVALLCGVAAFSA